MTIPADQLTALAEAADALDSNSRLLRMFELEPIIAAEPDSPEKHRALARVYAALGRYQTALTHFQTASDRKDPQDRADFAYLKKPRPKLRRQQTARRTSAARYPRAQSLPATVQILPRPARRRHLYHAGKSRLLRLLPARHPRVLHPPLLQLRRH